MKKLAKILALVVFMSLTTAGARQAHAVIMTTAQLSIDDGTTFVTIFDNGAGDSDSLVGFINYSAPSGTFANFVAAVSLGTTKPLIGSGDKPYLDLASVNVTSFGASADVLTIKFTDTDFTDLAPVVTGFKSEIGGVTDGTVTYATYFDNGNTAFGQATSLSDLGSFSGSAFSGSAYASLASLSPTPAGPYSLTLVTTVSNNAGMGKITSYNASVSVPEPSTLLLLGSGMLGFAFLRRRKKG
ncbi:MAG: hypothetical protein BMS9Abin24_035 [Thermodesulfobacteriota bacterium]|nr:MAG: hypothetical protein BMS9Abin24_035 [Thermodesulfobacteriota bacterium]